MTLPASSSLVERVCSRCEQSKPVSMFARRSERRSGYQSHCKACVNEIRIANGYYRREKRRKADKAKNKRLRATSSHRARERRHAAKSRAKHPEKAPAYRAVRAAIAAGTLVRPALCQSCGSSGSPMSDGRAAIQAHHHHGYDRPLDVLWLCVDCHAAHHRALAPTPKDDA